MCVRVRVCVDMCGCGWEWVGGGGWGSWCPPGFGESPNSPLILCHIKCSEIKYSV